MRSRGTPICSAGTYCVPCAAGPPPPANGAGATGGGGATRGATGAGAAGAELAAGAAEPEIAASMSCLLTRPPAPVPGTVVRSMPCSLAMRRTSGEECTRAASLRRWRPEQPRLAAGTAEERSAAWALAQQLLPELGPVSEQLWLAPEQARRPRTPPHQSPQLRC